MNPLALFDRMRLEIPGFVAAAVGSFDSDVIVTSPGGRPDLGEARGPLRALVSSYDALYGGLGGAVELGSNDELLVTASRGYLLVKVSHERRRFVAVLLASSGNIGYLRFRMRDYLRAAQEG